MGFRDSNQDLLGFVPMAPERARERILTSRRRNCPMAAPITSISPSPSGEMMLLAAASTTIPCG